MREKGLRPRPPPLPLSLHQTGPAGHVREWELRQFNLNKMKMQTRNALWCKIQVLSDRGGKPKEE